MTHSDDNLVKVADLLFASIEGTISPEQFAELEVLLQEDSVAMDAYIDLLNLVCSLSGPEAMIVLRKMCISGQMNDKLWQALGSMEEHSPIAEIEPPEETREETKVASINVERHGKKSFFKSAIAAAILLIFLVRMFVPSVAPVGVVTEQAGAIWQDSGKSYVHGYELYPGNFILSEGYAELTLADGAVVVVESPANFNLESGTRLYLHSGKVSVLIDSKSEGFCVRTDKADIIDLGTEFGVSADLSGNIDAHVFQGNVVVNAASVNSEIIKLKANQAVSIDNSWVVSKVVPASQRLFVRDINLVGQWQGYLDRNLIVNPGFETDVAGVYSPDAPGEEQITNVAISGWVDEGLATIYSYSHPVDEGFPIAGTNIIPDNCGNNFYVGVENGEVFQDIAFQELAPLVDGKGVRFKFSGWIGGFKDHEDSLEIIAIFNDENMQELAQFSFGPVTSEQRAYKSDFVFCESSGIVPVGSDSVRIILRTKRKQGIADAYADNLKLIFNSK